MQKLLALLMLATVLLSVSACGDRPDDQAEQFPPTVYDDIADGSPAPDNNSAGGSPYPFGADAGQREARHSRDSL